MTRRTLVVTNDFPPRQGGIQSFVHQTVLRQPAGSTMVYASTYPGAAEFDVRQPFPVVRHPTGLLVPAPAAIRRIARLVRAEQIEAVWFGAAAPLALMAPALRSAGATRIVASTHGHEVGWALLPPARLLLRRIGDGCDVVTYLGGYTRARLAGALGDHPVLAPLAPGVDVETFTPSANSTPIRRRLGLTERPVIVCVSRLVARKGQDVLIRALAGIRRSCPDAVLLLVGRGSDEQRLRRIADDLGLSDCVLFAGAVADTDLPAYLAAGDVFAMPCRTRRAGMDVEGLGIVYLEASATGLPVVAGSSGGAPDAVQDGITGFVVDGRDVDAVADRIAVLLRDRSLARRMGAAGRAWVERDWRWEGVAQRLRDLLDE